MVVFFCAVAPVLRPFLEENKVGLVCSGGYLVSTVLLAVFRFKKAMPLLSV